MARVCGGNTQKGVTEIIGDGTGQRRSFQQELGSYQGSGRVADLTVRHLLHLVAHHGFLTVLVRIDLLLLLLVHLHLHHVGLLLLRVHLLLLVVLVLHHSVRIESFFALFNCQLAPNSNLPSRGFGVLGFWGFGVMG